MTIKRNCYNTEPHVEHYYSDSYCTGQRDANETRARIALTASAKFLARALDALCVSEDPLPDAAKLQSALDAINAALGDIDGRFDG